MTCASSLGRLDGTQMLLEAPAWSVQRIGADDQDAVCTLERRLQSVRTIEISRAHVHTARREPEQFVRRARQRNDFLPLALFTTQKQLQDTPTQMPGGARHQQGPIRLICHAWILGEDWMVHNWSFWLSIVPDLEQCLVASMI